MDYAGNAHVDQQRQRAERLGARSPRGDGRLDRRGSVQPSSRAPTTSSPCCPTRPSRSTPTARTGATTSRSARRAARSRRSSTPAPRTAAPAPATSTTSSTRRTTRRWCSPTSTTTVAKVKRTGRSSGAGSSSGRRPRTFTGDTWAGGEHGIHVLGLDELLIFNNNSRRRAARRRRSTAPTTARSRSRSSWTHGQERRPRPGSYKGAGTAYQNDVMGDVQRLRTATPSSPTRPRGMINEVDASGTVLQTLTDDGRTSATSEARDAVRSAAAVIPTPKNQKIEDLR